MFSAARRRLGKVSVQRTRVGHAAGHAGPVGRLLFSTTATEEEQKKGDKKTRFMTAAVLGGGGVVLYGITTFSLDVMRGFLSLTPMAMGYYGFMAGTISTASLGLMVGIGSRNTSIDPLNINRWSISQVNKSTTVNSLLGGSAKRKGDIYAVRQSMGHWTVESAKLTWKPAMVQMCYDVEGPSGKTAVVAVEAMRMGLLGKDEITFCAIMGREQGATPILVKGAVDRLDLLEDLQGKVTFH